LTLVGYGSTIAPDEDTVPTALADRKKRISLRLPVAVSGEDARGSAFVEHTHCMNVSGGGILFESGQKLLVGTRLRLRIEIPEQLRKHFEDREVWQTAAVITRLEAMEGQTVIRVGARFLEGMLP
jgi:hypothetical protein